MENSNFSVSRGAQVCDKATDKSPTRCRGDDKASLPRDARLPINRCNLPAVVLGSLSYQRHPSPLVLDGVAELHADLFRRLERVEPALQGQVFRDYMTVLFALSGRRKRDSAA